MWVLIVLATQCFCDLLNSHTVPELTNAFINRSAHVLSESIRLQFSTAGLQNSLSVCATTANQSNEPLNATRSRKLLIVTGPSGSGVRAVGGLIKGQLTAHADMQKHHIDCAAINLPDIFSSCADDTMTACVLLRTLEDKACEALTQPRGNGFTSSVTIVVVTIAPEFHIAQSDLIKLISSVAQTCSPGVHVSIAAVVAVVAPKSLMSDTTTSPDMYVPFLLCFLIL